MFNDLINSADVPIQWTTCTVHHYKKPRKKETFIPRVAIETCFVRVEHEGDWISLDTKTQVGHEEAMSDFQFAYKSGCGCHTLIAKYIQITKTRKYGISLFFDIKLAFSSVNRKSMFNDIFHKLGRDAFIFK